MLLALGACSGSDPQREGGAAGDSRAGAPTGSPCAGTADCESFCLTSVVYFGQPKAFPGGYCTRKCAADPECGGSDVCMAFTDAAGSIVARYCVAGCPPAACRSGYVCTSGNVCMPP